MAMNMNSLTQQMSREQYERMKMEEKYMRQMQKYDPFMYEAQYGAGGGGLAEALGQPPGTPKPEPKAPHQNPKLLLTRKA